MALILKDDLQESEFNKFKPSEKIPWKDLEMLINFYTPEIKSEFDELNQCREFYSRLITERWSNCLDIKEFNSKLFSSMKKMDDICMKMKTKIILISQKYTELK